MGASPIVRAFYQELITRFGEPDESIRFDKPPPPKDSGWPELIDVFIWKDEEDFDIVTFSTVGMADKPMRGCKHRCELHFSVRAKAADLDLMKLSAFCANMALYPFMNETYFDWAQTVFNPGDIPCFPSCKSILLYPAFVKDGWDEVKFDDTKVKIMNLVPITGKEVEYRKKNGPFSIFDYFCENEIDLFKDRGESLSI